MLDTEEIRWVKSTANELNNLLQVISESSQFLEMVQINSADSEKYFGFLRSGGSQFPVPTLQAAGVDMSTNHSNLSLTQ